MREFALRDVLVLTICVVLIAGGALFFFNRQSSNQESVALEPIKAVPMRVPNASDSAPQPTPQVRTPQKLEPRAVTSQTPASSTTSSDTSSSSASSSDSSTSETSTSETSTSETTVPEPSERPSDATNPSDATLPSPSSEAASETNTAAATPSALPVRNSAQGWAVQAGAFKNASNATTLRDRLLKAGLAARVEIGADGVNRVLVGAYVSADAAKAASPTVAAALK